MSRTFVGFGFGAIQAGLFVYEAFRSGNFERLVVAEVVPETVEAVRRAGGRFRVNIATDSGIETSEIAGLEILDPSVPKDAERLLDALEAADEIATALPSVKFYAAGETGSVADIIADSLRRRVKPRRSIIYTAENDNRAAEILERMIAERLGGQPPFIQCLNTVIGKMSGVVDGEARIREQGLKCMTPDSSRCFLVESFNRILVSRVRWPDFERGIKVFEEKADLLPFEEAKLYGHNATHALIGYMARKRGLATIADIRNDHPLRDLAREAFLYESGAALCRRHAGIDPLFTPEGYREYVEDLLKRMMNPYLRDSVERVVRDPRRKLGWNDRLVGVMRIAVEQGIKPVRYAMGARAAVDMLAEEENVEASTVLDDIWSDSTAGRGEKEALKSLILSAGQVL